MSNENRILRTDSFLTEKEMGDWLGVNKNQLGDLRRKEGLPYIRINKVRRMYFENDVTIWLLSRKWEGGAEVSSK